MTLARSTNRPVAVVTGANRGLGFDIALALSDSGFAVAAAGRNRSGLEDLLDTIADRGGEARGFEADVTSEESIDALGRAVDEWGAVRSVIANAGIAGPTAPLHKLTLADWQATIATDLDSVFLTFRAFIPGMIERGNGSLVAISSMTGKRPLTGRTPYAAAKMGIIGLVRTLAAELGPHGIRANAICPGAISGNRIDDVIRLQAQARGISAAEARSAFTDSSPLGRLVSGAEVAAACAFLASDGSSSITGEDMNVSAGVVMY